MSNPDPWDGDSPENLMCAQCCKRKASTWWSDGGILGAVHGAYSPRCEMCCVEAQLEHAMEMAAGIPELETKLQLLKMAENVDETQNK